MRFALQMLRAKVAPSWQWFRVQGYRLKGLCRLAMNFRWSDCTCGRQRGGKLVQVLQVLRLGFRI